MDCPQAIETLLELDDPRIDSDVLRCHPGDATSGNCLLVGVVHDHPASVARVRLILETLSPDHLALELPPLAVPLFQLYAQDDKQPPALGGEMSAAIQAANRARIRGIDAPNSEYLRLWLRDLFDNRPTPGVFRALARDLLASSGHAIACWVGWLLGSITPIRLQVYAHIEYDSSQTDPPATQAEHEAAHVATQQSFLRAIETPPTIRRIRTLREASMARELAAMRQTGDVIAIVGIDHLDDLLQAMDQQGRITANP